MVGILRTNFHNIFRDFVRNFLETKSDFENRDIRKTFQKPKSILFISSSSGREFRGKDC